MKTDDQTHIESKLHALGIIGQMAADDEDLPLCIQIAGDCQKLIKQLMDMGVHKAKDGRDLATLYATGEAMLAKYRN